MTRQPGDKVIPKMIPVIRDTIIATKKGLFWHDKEVQRLAKQEVVDRAGHEVADLYRPFIDKLIATGTLPDDVARHLESIGSGEHQWQALAGMAFGASGASSAISTVLNNFLAPAIRNLVSTDPELMPDPSTIAGLVARGFIDYGYGDSSAAGQGYNRNWFNALVQASMNPPDAASAFEAVNRGLMPEFALDDIMSRNGIPETYRGPIKALRFQVLAPADAALAVLRNNMSLSEGQQVAQANGLNDDQFNVLIGNTGEPPGVMDMLAMLRRGIIDEPTLVHGILESRLRNEWVDAILAYRYQPMTTADAIDALVQNHLTDSEARKIADQNGLEPSAFDPLVQTAGEPLSKTEMLQLYRRGEVTADQVKQALRESRLKDKYIDTALLLSRAIPALYEIRAMLTAGAITDADATKLLAEDGYEDFVIKAILKTAHKTKTAKVRTITEGMLSELYQEHAISASDFVSQLILMGYSKAEAAQIQEIDDWRIAKTNRDQVITHLRSAYVGHKISSAEAQAGLDAAQVPSDMRDKLIADWDLEIKSAVKLLSEAQIADAWSFGIIDVATALAMLVNLGYSGKDAGMLLEIKNKGPLGK